MRGEKPSKTAYKVAMNILTLGAKPDTAGILPVGIVEATEQLLILSNAASVTSVRWARCPQMARVYEAFDWMMPGQFEAFAHRKAFFERRVRDSIEAGTSQILVLGAGYDTMGWRMAPEFPQVEFFEIDHPATARLKAKGVAAMGSRPNLHLLAEDLGQRSLLDVLATNEDWNQNSTTAIVAEGLLQYLTPVAVRALLMQCAAVGGESRIVFTYIPTREDGRPDAGPWTGLVLRLLKVSGEQWLWSLRPEDLDVFLMEMGWTIAPKCEVPATTHGVERYAVALKSRIDSGIMNSAEQRLARRLGNPYVGTEDWDLSGADASRVDEFCDLYESGSLPDDEKQLLIELVVSSLDRLLQANPRAPAQQRVESLLKRDWSLHVEVIWYWAATHREDSPWRVTSMMRRVNAVCDT